MDTISFVDKDQASLPIVTVRKRSRLSNPTLPADEMLNVSVSADPALGSKSLEIAVNYGRYPTIDIGGVELSVTAFLSIFSRYLVMDVSPVETDHRRFCSSAFDDPSISQCVIDGATRIITTALFPGESPPETFSIVFRGNAKVCTAYLKYPEWDMSKLDRRLILEGRYHLRQGGKPQAPGGALDPPSVPIVVLGEKWLASDLLGVTVTIAFETRMRERPSLVAA